MKFEVNNGRKIELVQYSENHPVCINSININGRVDDTEIITAGDFITMLNWYRYQKSNGNTNLEF